MSVVLWHWIFAGCLAFHAFLCVHVSKFGIPGPSCGGFILWFPFFYLFFGRQWTIIVAAHWIYGVQVIKFIASFFKVCGMQTSLHRSMVMNAIVATRHICACTAEWSYAAHLFRFKNKEKCCKKSSTDISGALRLVFWNSLASFRISPEYIDLCIYIYSVQGYWQTAIYTSCVIRHHGLRNFSRVEATCGA